MKDESFWDVHDSIRTAELNVRYYVHILDEQKTQYIVLEVLLSILSPTGAVATLAIWNSSQGKAIWSWLLLIPALLGVLKPLLKQTDLISKLEKTIAGYQLQKADLENLVLRAKRRNKFDQKLRDEYFEIFSRKKILIQDTALLKERRKLKIRYENEIRDSYHDSFLPEV